MTNAEPWSWHGVASSRLPEPAAIHAQLVDAIAPHAALQPEPRGHAIVASLLETLAREGGALARGALWARGEGTFDGGVVGAWCCVHHSVPQHEGPLSPDEISSVATLAARGLGEWRAHLERVVATIEACEAPTDELAVVRSVARLSDVVARASEASSGWHRHAAQVIGWYLERHDVADAQRIAGAAVSGIFASWTAPTDGDMRRCGEAVARSLTGLPRPPDALALHLASTLDWYHPPDDIARAELALLPRPIDDAMLAPHRAAIDAIDGPRDAERARRMHAALDRMVGFGRGPDWLTLDHVREVHAIAMGHTVLSPLRTTDAFAKGGAERYCIPMHGLEALDGHLAFYAHGPVTALARAYLDVLFFHPFDDGNARAARLVAAWFDLNGRIGFADLVPAFTIPRAAGDDESTWGLVRTLVASAERCRR